MDQESILDWMMSFGNIGMRNPKTNKVDYLRKNLPEYITIPGNMSVYENFEKALELAEDSDSNHLKYVIFVILI